MKYITAKIMVVAVGFIVSSCAQPEPKVEYLQAEPAAGSVPSRNVVYVDDGICPHGEVKEITGGTRMSTTVRQVRCVKRPH